MALPIVRRSCAYASAASNAARATPTARAARHPHLRSGDHILLAVTYSATRDVARVAARVGLGERETAADLTGGEPRQPALLLLVGAVVHDEIRRDRVCVHDARQRHPP